MKAAYGKKYQKQKDMEKTTSDMMAIYLGISVLVLRELWGFGYERNSKYSENLSEMLDGWFEQYKSPGREGAIEAVSDINFAAKRDVRELGVDLDDIDNHYSPKMPEAKYRYEHGNPVKRIEFLKATDESMSSIWLLTMLWLHNEYGFGAIKMARYYLYCRRKLSEFYFEYLKCSENGDKRCVEFRNQIISDCDAIGVNVM